MLNTVQNSGTHTLAFVVLCLLALTVPAAAQTSQQQEYKVKVHVELVTAALTVTDASGQFVPGLQPTDFEIYDNGQLQKIEQFQPIPQPISMVILVNTSDKLEPLLPRLQKLGILFADLVLGQTGEAAVVEFDNEIRVSQGFTSDANQLIATLKRVRAGGRGSRLVDAMSRALLMLRDRKPDRRKVIVIISGPEDRGSESKLGEPLREAQLNDVAVYTIGLSPLEAALLAKPESQPSPFPPGTMPTPGIPGSVHTPTTQQAPQVNLMAAIVMLVQSLRNTLGENPLKLYAAGTGGAYFPTLSKSSLEEAVNRIGQELHNQYVITYRLTNADWGFHEISARVLRPGLIARTRPGYYIGPPEP